MSRYKAKSREPRWVFPLPWPEAQVIDLPSKVGKEPKVLVRRNKGKVFGVGGEELVYLHGNPCISLFTGAGGADIGLERAGFTCLCQHEWSEFPCQTLIANRPDFFRHAALIQGDIRLTPTSIILKEAGLRVGECHLLVGGPPCQGFSTCNSNRGKAHDPRNDLVFEYLRVTDDAKPHFFFFENVPGFMSLNGGSYFEAFLKRAYECYYDLVYGLIDCSEYGVPQRRIRFVCMGTRRDASESHGALAALPKPEHFGKRDLRALKILEPFSPQYEHVARAPGVRYFPERPILRPPSPDQNGDNGGRSKGFLEYYRHLEETEPDRIVRAPREEAA